MVLQRGNSTPSDTRVNPSATLSPTSPAAAMVFPGWAGRPRPAGRATGEVERDLGLVPGQGPKTWEPLRALGFGCTFPPRDLIPAVLKAKNLLITQFCFEVLETRQQPLGHVLPAPQLWDWAQPWAWAGFIGVRNQFLCTDDKTSVAHTLHLLGLLPYGADRFLHILSQHLLDGSGKQLLGRRQPGESRKAELFAQN